MISISSADGEITFEESDGRIYATISSAKTAAATPGMYDYELEISIGSDDYKIVVGKFEVTGETTV